MSWRIALTKRVGPGGFTGAIFTDWLRILRRAGFSVDPQFWPRAAVITGNSLLNSLLGIWEQWRYSAKIAETSVPDPLFVLGVWRSGTTHLHNLLAQDTRFAFPTTYEVYYPHSFLSTESWNARNVAACLPATRPMDNVRFGVGEPQEDEFALAACGLSFLIESMAFPRTGGHFHRFLTLRGASSAEVTAWKARFIWFLRKLTLKHGRPLVLKSPAHTSRIKLLLELFPHAKFVHIHRSPYDVFQSSLHTIKTATPYWALQEVQPTAEGVLRDYSEIYDAYFEERRLIPAANFTEVAFEKLEQDPVGEIRRIYTALRLPEFEYVEPRLRDYVASLKGYSKNRFPPLTEELCSAVERAWRRSFDEWGYPVGSDSQPEDSNSTSHRSTPAGRSSMTNLDQLIEQAFEASESEDVDAAIELWTDVLAIDPRNAQAFFERGFMHLSNDDLEGAVGDFLACLAEDSVFPGARNWLARAYLQAGNNAGAASEFETALRADISVRDPYISPQQWADCASAYESAGDIRNARRILSEYFEKYAARVNIHHDLETAPMRQYASLLLASRELQEAMRYASLAYKSRHRKPIDVLVYANAAEGSGDLALARRLCAEAMNDNDQMPGLRELNERLNP